MLLYLGNTSWKSRAGEPIDLRYNIEDRRFLYRFFDGCMTNPLKKKYHALKRSAKTGKALRKKAEGCLADGCTENVFVQMHSYMVLQY